MPAITRRPLLAALLGFAFGGGAACDALAQSDPLPSWNDGAAKKTITDFVARVTTHGGPEFVPIDQRIATFDNDGTLWCEQPFYFQLAFAIDRVKVLAAQHPEWKTQQPFKGLLENDMTVLAASGEKGLLAIVAATHAGMPVEEFTKTVLDWINTARHPKFNRPYTDLVYQPMLELMAYLRTNGFKTFIVSGGGIEFMRPWTERVYGIPPEQVVGSSGVTTFQIGPDGKPVLMKEARSNSSTMAPASQSASTASSAVGRFSRLVIPTAICRCCNIPWGEPALASHSMFTMTMPSGNMPMTVIQTLESWTRVSMKRAQRAGRWSA
jgi:hypothetical protein